MKQNISCLITILSVILILVSTDTQTAFGQDNTAPSIKGILSPAPESGNASLWEGDEAYLNVKSCNVSNTITLTAEDPSGVLWLKYMYINETLDDWPSDDDTRWTTITPNEGADPTTLSCKITMQNVTNESYLLVMASDIYNNKTNNDYYKELHVSPAVIEYTGFAQFNLVPGMGTVSLAPLKFTTEDNTDLTNKDVKCKITKVVQESTSSYHGGYMEAIGTGIINQAEMTIDIPEYYTKNTTFTVTYELLDNVNYKLKDNKNNFTIGVRVCDVFVFGTHLAYENGNFATNLPISLFQKASIGMAKISKINFNHTNNQTEPVNTIYIGTGEHPNTTVYPVNKTEEGIYPFESLHIYNKDLGIEIEKTFDVYIDKERPENFYYSTNSTKPTTPPAWSDNEDDALTLSYGQELYLWADDYASDHATGIFKIQYEIVDPKNYIILNESIDKLKKENQVIPFRWPDENNGKLLSTYYKLQETSYQIKPISINKLKPGTNYLVVFAEDNAGNQNYKVQRINIESPIELTEEPLTLQYQMDVDKAFGKYIKKGSDGKPLVTGTWKIESKDPDGIYNVIQHALLESAEHNIGDMFPDVRVTFVPDQAYKNTYPEITFENQSLKIVKRKVYIDSDKLKDLYYFPREEDGFDIFHDRGLIAIDSIEAASPNEGEDFTDYITYKSSDESVLKVDDKIQTEGYSKKERYIHTYTSDGTVTLTPVIREDYISKYEIVTGVNQTKIPTFKAVVKDVIVTYNNGGEDQEMTLEKFKNTWNTDHWLNKLEIASPFNGAGNTPDFPVSFYTNDIRPNSKEDAIVSLDSDLFSEGPITIQLIEGYHNYRLDDETWYSVCDFRDGLVINYDATRPLTPEVIFPEENNSNVFTGENDISFTLKSYDPARNMDVAPSCVAKFRYWIDDSEPIEINAGESTLDLQQQQPRYAAETQVKLSADYLKTLSQDIHTIHVVAIDNAGNECEEEGLGNILVPSDIEVDSDTLAHELHAIEILSTGVSTYHGEEITGLTVAKLSQDNGNAESTPQEIGEDYWSHSGNTLTLSNIDDYCPSTGLYVIGFKLKYLGESEQKLYLRVKWTIKFENFEEGDTLKTSEEKGHCPNMPAEIETGALESIYTAISNGETDNRITLKSDNGQTWYALWLLDEGKLKFNIYTNIADTSTYMPEGTNDYNIVFSDGKENFSDPLPMKAKMKVSANKIQMLYNDVLFVDNGEGYYTDTSYHWYENDILLPNETNQFIELSQEYTQMVASNPNYKVNVSLYSTKTNENILSCYADSAYIPSAFGYNPESISKKAKRQIAAYPNPAVANQDITIELLNFGEQDMEGCYISIANSMGNKVAEIKAPQQANHISLPAGIYTIKAISLNGNRTKTSAKLVVR
ncbi:MAG: T9SS type A sorting domain-containing protein [Bacteroidales bacterium]|nr:T9SS type A sorting domain-containing protein [Bacteroidales bacterium]